MRILDVLLANTAKASRSRSPADLVAFPSGFRGELDHQAGLCVGCSTCSYVCSPGAIRIDCLPEHIVWQYMAVQCTFCGKCVEYCPTKALSFQQQSPANQVGSETAFTAKHGMAYHNCRRCGERIVPLPVPTLERLYGSALPEDLLGMMQLCEKCRNRTTVERMKGSLCGQYHPTGVEK